MRAAGRKLAESRGVGLLAFDGTRLIGHGCLIPTDPGSAEVAFVVADTEQAIGWRRSCSSASSRRPSDSTSGG